LTTAHRISKVTPCEFYLSYSPSLPPFPPTTPTGPASAAPTVPASPRSPGLPSNLTDKNIRWTTDLPGTGHSSPVVYGKKVFLASVDAEDTRRCLTCLDADSGKIKWTTWLPVQRYRVHRDNSLAAATPSVDADAIYLSWVTDGHVEALAFDHDGKKLWQQKLGAFEAKHGPGASLCLVGDTVIVTNDQMSTEAALYGLDRKTGKTRWQVKRNSAFPSYATPPVYYTPDGKPRLVIASPAHGLTGIDPATGKIDWAVEGIFTLNVVASPVVSNGLVFASTGRGGSREAAVVSFDGKGAAKVLYQPEDDLPYVPSGIAIGQNVFLWDDRGTVTCFDFKTGDIAWSEQVTGPTYTSPVSDGKRIFGINRKGEMVVIAADTKLRELGSYQLPEGTHATPAIAHGSLYVRTFTKLIRFSP
jgi:outer membrane protein assembly factor BamB